MTDITVHPVTGRIGAEIDGVDISRPLEGDAIRLTYGHPYHRPRWPISRCRRMSTCIEQIFPQLGELGTTADTIALLDNSRARVNERSR